MPRSIQGDVLWVGAVDWHRRLFDSLIPLPDGTSYNAYLVRGTNATALLDSVDPSMGAVLMATSRRSGRSTTSSTTTSSRITRATCRNC